MEGQPDFEKEGLLEGLDSEVERAARADLLRELHASGVSLDQLRRAVEEDRLAVMPLELVFQREARYTPRQMLEELELSEDFARRNYLSLGLPMPELDELAISEQEMEAWRMIRVLFDAGVDEEIVYELGRQSGRFAAQMADALLQTFARLFLRQGDTEHDFGMRIAEVATNLGPALGPLTESPVRLHLRERVRQEAVGRLERQTGRLPGTREVAVCFADMVGFTALTERVESPELDELTRRLEEIAADCARPPVRLVKLIGDAAMFVSTDAVALIEAAERLLAQAADEDDFPELRVGMACGSALNRGGDWYGRPVNLAARVTPLAEAGMIVATSAVAERSDGRFSWDPFGTHELKGVEGAVEVQRLRVAEGT